MSSETENCPQCETPNSFQSLNCLKCGAELPWADWVRAARVPSPALGAQRKHYFRPGEDQYELGSVLPTTTVLKIAFVVVPILLVLGAAYFALGLVSQRGAPPGSIVAKFKKADPVFRQDEAMRRDDKQ